jgi:hypothetical protein
VVEHRLYTPAVTGSNPVPPTKCKTEDGRRKYERERNEEEEETKNGKEKQRDSALLVNFAVSFFRLPSSFLKMGS